MTAFRKAGEGFFVAPQISEADFARAADEGVAMIVNNRPDGESPTQLSDAEARAAAEAAGLGYRHIPVGPPPLGPEAAAALAEAMESAGGPVLAYCASGMRSAAVWALVEAQKGKPAEDILSALEACGYPLPQLRPALEMMGAG